MSKAREWADRRRGAERDLEIAACARPEFTSWGPSSLDVHAHVQDSGDTCEVWVKRVLGATDDGHGHRIVFDEEVAVKLGQWFVTTFGGKP